MDYRKLRFLLEERPGDIPRKVQKRLLARARIRLIVAKDANQCRAARKQLECLRSRFADQGSIRAHQKGLYGGVPRRASQHFGKRVKIAK